MIHELKIQKQWADAKLAGEKPFEIRRNDRGFQKGDVVHYTVVDPKTGEPWKGKAELHGQSDGRITINATGLVHPIEQCDFLITYVREGADGLEKGYCVYADQPVPKGGARPNGRGETFFEGFARRTEDRLCKIEEALAKRPVSADLGSGATPSNGTAEPLAPPSPLAES